MPGWTYSPVAELEGAIRDIRHRYPADYPAGLARMRSFLERLGNPHQKLPFVFHVAGTNGKGSTLAFLQAAFEAGGLAVHKYTSPHLVRFEERIVLAGKDIDPAGLLALIGECDRAAGAGGVSFFEFFTGLAFLAFSRTPAAAVLLETGLGGLHDATNVVAGPRLLSLLTRISFDHTHILGATLPEIAGQKAGIIKPGCAAIVAPQASAEVEGVFAREAQRLGAPLFRHGREWSVRPQAPGFEYQSAQLKLLLPGPALQGRHQVDNAGTALAALEQSPYAFLLGQQNLEKALAAVSWPARLQRLSGGALSSLLPAGWELWLDGAHNDSGAEVLAAQAALWGREKPLHLLTAMKKTKDISRFYQVLLPHLATVQTVDVAHIEAPMIPAGVLCDQIRALGHPSVGTAANLESALRALTFQFSAPQRIIIAGSLYLAGHVLAGEHAHTAAHRAGG